MSIQIGTGNSPQTTLTSTTSERIILRSATESNIIRISSGTERATFNCDEYNFGRFSNVFQLSQCNTPLLYAQPSSTIFFNPLISSNIARFRSNVAIEKDLTTFGLSANTVQITGSGLCNILNINRSTGAPIVNITPSGTVNVYTPTSFSNLVNISSNVNINNSSKLAVDEVQTFRIIERGSDENNILSSIELKQEANERLIKITSPKISLTGNVAFYGIPTFYSPVEIGVLTIKERLLASNLSANFTYVNDLTSSNIFRITYNGNIDNPTNSNTNLVDFVIRPADSNIAAFSVDQRGLVGIGTSNPDALLDILATSNHRAPYHIRALDTVYPDDCHTFAVSSNAYVGIGTSVPSYKLHVRCCDDDPFMVGTSNDTDIFRISNRGQLTIGMSNVDSSLAIDVTPTMQTRIPHVEMYSLIGNTSNSNIIDGRQSQLCNMQVVTSSNSYLDNIYTKNIYADYIFTNSYENLGMDCIEGNIHMFQVKVNRFQHMGRSACFSPSSNDFPEDPVTGGKLKIVCETPSVIGSLSRGIAVEGPVNTSILVESSNNAAFYEMTSRKLTTAAKARLGLQVDGTIVLGHDSWANNPSSDFTDSTTPKVRIRPINNSFVTGTPVVEMLSSTVVTNNGVHINQTNIDTTRAFTVSGSSRLNNDQSDALLVLSGTNGARRVGICTDNPLFNFDVNGAANFRDVARFNSHVGIGTTNSTNIDLLHIASSNNASRNLLVLNNISGGTGSTLRVLTSRSNVIIDNFGNVGIGSTLPVFELDLRGNFNFTGALYKNGSRYIESQWTTVANTDNVYILGNVGIGTLTPQAGLHVENRHIYCSSNITADGTMYSRGSFITTSDRSVKSDLVQITDSLDRLARLNGYTYWRNDISKREAGLVAQEVVEVLPEAVHKDASSGMMSVAYGNMAALFVEAIKELRDRITKLESRISSCSPL